MLTICFDGSGKEDDPVSPLVTLGGFAAEDQAWDHFNHHWKLSLDELGVSHLHMVDLLRRSPPYQGWREKDISFLMQKLSLVPPYIARYFRIQGARFSVDATAHRRWAGIVNPCRMSENLAVGLFDRLFRWYAESPKPILDRIAIQYDRGEPYLNYMKQRWNRRASSNRDKPEWYLISSIDAVDSKRVYGVQAADMLAWSYNRLRVHGKSDFAGRIAELVMSRTPHVYNEVEDFHFRKVKLIGEIF